MTIPLWILLGFAAWTLFLLMTTVTIPAARIVQSWLIGIIVAAQTT
jgi:hypothetical protein